MAEKIVTARKQTWIKKLKKNLVEAGLDKETVDDLLQDKPTVRDVTNRLKKAGLDTKTIKQALSDAGTKAETKIKEKDKISEPHPEAEKHLKKFSDKKEKAMIAVVTVISFLAGVVWGGLLT